MGYHSHTNGQCKRFNATLINMLGMLPGKLKSTWREQEPTFVHAYNCTRNDATDFSPNYLMFGRKPHLSIDIIFGTNTAELKGNTSTDYVEYLKQRLQWAYKTAEDVVKKEQEWNKWHFDCKVRCAQLKVGVKVLLKYTAFKGRHKIQNSWENTIYEVIEQPIGKMPVFKIRSMESDGKTKVVHWNLLPPLFSYPSDHTNASDIESMVDQTVNSHSVIVVSTVISNVQNMSAYSRSQVTSLFQQGLQFSRALFE